MRDRQIFDEIKLKNGITIYSYPMEEVDFFSANLVVPVGTGNNTAGVIEGSAHMLEHMLMNRSQLHQKKDEYDELLGLKGGYANAHTSVDDTTFEIEAPSVEFENLWPGFLARPLDPFLSEEDLKNERTIISNERNRRRWYPGNSELSHHLFTEWKYYSVVSLEQIFGSDENLNSMSGETLLSLQKNYYDPRMYLVIGGKFNMETVKTSLEKIETKQHVLSQKIGTIEWKHKEYAEKGFKDVNNFSYMVSAMFQERLDFQTTMGMTFIFRLLTNTIQNNLYYWLRKQNGWTYSISQSVHNGSREWSWALEISLDDKSHVQRVREELHEKIQNIISDEKMVSSEVDRIAKKQVFSFQTLDGILNSALNDLDDYGRIYTEKEYYQAKKKCRDVTYLKELYEKYIAPPNGGEFLATPEEK